MNDEFDYDVFLSHNSTDKPTVRELANKLRDCQFQVWFDEWVIDPGRSIPNEIEQGLRNSRTLVLCMSSSAFASDWVTLERQTATFRDPMNKQLRLIPLLIADAEIPDMLKQFAYIDYRERSIESFQRLVTALS